MAGLVESEVAHPTATTEKQGSGTLVSASTCHLSVRTMHSLRRLLSPRILHQAQPHTLTRRTFITTARCLRDSSHTNPFIPPTPRSQRSPSSGGSTNFYRSHGRALFKSLTLAFLSYQIFYWAWITLETETMKDEKTRSIKGLEGEVRLLSEGRGSHVLGGGEKRLLDEEESGKSGRSET